MVVERWKEWVGGLEAGLASPSKFDWETLRSVHSQLIGSLESFLKTYGQGHWANTVGRWEQELPTSIPQFGRLLEVFRCKPTSEMQWATAEYLILLQNVVIFGAGCAERTVPATSPCYTELLKLCLVDCPARVVDMVAMAASPPNTSIERPGGGGRAVSQASQCKVFLRGALALARLVLQRLANGGCLPDPVSTAKSLAGCYKRLVHFIDQCILPEDFCQEAMDSLMAASSRLFSASFHLGSAEAAVSVWDAFEAEPGFVDALAVFMIVEAAEEGAKECLPADGMPSAWQDLAVALQAPCAGKGAPSCFRRVVAARATSQECWQELLQQLGTASVAACSAVQNGTAGGTGSRAGITSSTAGGTGNTAVLKRALDLTGLWHSCSEMHGTLLAVLKGPGATDAVAAQWAESVGLHAVGHSLDISAMALPWGDSLQHQRGFVLHVCENSVFRFLCFNTEEEEEALEQPAFLRFTSSSSSSSGGGGSRAQQQSPRIRGRQAVEAAMHAVELAKRALRLAARHPLSQWPLDRSEACEDPGEGPEQGLPWDLCYVLATTAARSLAQKLPARRGGPPPAQLISLVEEGAVLPFFRSLLGLLATQRKLFCWCARVLPVSDRDPRRPAFRCLGPLGSLATEAATAALTALAPRVAAQRHGSLTHQRCVEAVSAVALATVLSWQQLVAPYERWALQQGLGSDLLLARCHLAGELLEAVGRLEGGTSAGRQAALHAGGVVLWAAGGLDQEAGLTDLEQYGWVSMLCSVLGVPIKLPPGLLLLAAVQSGLLRLLAGWAERASQHDFGEKAQDVASLLAVVGTLFTMSCKEVDRHLQGEKFMLEQHQHLKAVEEAGKPTSRRRASGRRTAASLRDAKVGLWQARRQRLLPQMEAAVAWGSRHMVTWGSSNRGEAERCSNQQQPAGLNIRTESSIVGVVVAGRGSAIPAAAVAATPLSLGQGQGDGPGELGPAAQPDCISPPTEGGIHRHTGPVDSSGCRHSGSRQSSTTSSSNLTRHHPAALLGRCMQSLCWAACCVPTQPVQISRAPARQGCPCSDALGAGWLPTAVLHVQGLTGHGTAQPAMPSDN